MKARAVLLGEPNYSQADIVGETDSLRFRKLSGFQAYD